MEFNRVEMVVIESTETEAADAQAQELNDLQLAIVGGGNATVVFT
jgi:hypothetical protein